MAKKELNVVEVIKNYLFFKSAFSDEKVRKYNEQLKATKNTQKSDLIAIYNEYVRDVGAIKIPSLDGSGKLVSLDVYLNDLYKTYKVNGGQNLKASSNKEFELQVDEMLSKVLSSKETIKAALENGGYSEIEKKHRLAVGKTGGKQIYSVANEMTTAANVSGLKTYISSLERQISNLEEKNKGAQEKAKIGEKIGKLSDELALLRLLSQASFTSLDSKFENVNSKLDEVMNSQNTIINNQEKQNEKLDVIVKNTTQTNKQSKSNRVKQFVGGALISVICFGGGLFTGKFINKNSVQNKMNDKIVDVLEDGNVTFEEIQGLRDYVATIKKDDLRNYYTIVVDGLEKSANADSLQDDLNQANKDLADVQLSNEEMASNIFKIANEFGIPFDSKLNDELIKSNIISDKNFRDKTVEQILECANSASNVELKQIGNALNIDAQKDNESNSAYKLRIITAIQSLITERDDLKAQVENLNAQINSINDELNQIAEKLNNLKDIKGNTNLEKIDLLITAWEIEKTKYNLIEKSYKSCKEKYENEQKDHEQTRQDLENADIKIKELENKITKLDGQLQEAKDTITSLENQLTAANKKADDLQSELDKINSSGNVSLSDYEKLQDKYNTLQTEKNNLEAQLGSNSKEIKELNKKITNLEGQIISLNNQLGDLTLENEQLQARIEELLGSISSSGTLSQEQYNDLQLLKSALNLSSMSDEEFIDFLYSTFGIPHAESNSNSENQENSRQ